MNGSKRFITLAISILTLVFWSNSSFSQIWGTDQWIQGKFLEVGVGSCGCYGTSAGPGGAGPYGTYNNTSAWLGWVADPDMDGWATGTPNYCGDFYMPGFPTEGHMVEYNSKIIGNYGRCGSSSRDGGITGAHTTQQFSCNTRSGIWKGSANSGSDRVDMILTTYFDVDSVWFVGEMVIINSGSTTLSDVYYNRNCDPDNAVAWGGSFTTDNYVISQPGGGTDLALVTAEETSGNPGLDKCFLAIGSVDPRARVGVIQSGLFVNHPSASYLGIADYLGRNHDIVVGGPYTRDASVYITFDIGDLAPGDTACVKYAYCMDANSINAAMAATASGATVYGGSGGDSIALNGGGYEICPGGIVDLDITCGENFFWEWYPKGAAGGWIGPDTGITVASSPPNSVQIYAIGTARTGATAGTCGGNKVQLTVNIEVDTVPVFIHAGPDLFICEGEDSIDLITIDYGDPVSYYWEDITNPGSPAPGVADHTAPITRVKPTVTTTYVCNVIDKRGCLGADTITVEVIPEPNVDAGPNQLVYEGVATTMNGNAGSGVYWWWDPGTEMVDSLDLQTSVTPTESRWYTLCAIDDKGCQGCDSVFLEVTRDPLIYFPNAFTPNGDGLNDEFKAWALGTMVDVTFMVYNRYGEVVFQTSDPNKGWDGTHKGQPADNGNYVFSYEGTDDREGIQVQRKGVVTIVR